MSTASPTAAVAGMGKAVRIIRPRGIQVAAMAADNPDIRADILAAMAADNPDILADMRAAHRLVAVNPRHTAHRPAAVNPAAGNPRHNLAAGNLGSHSLSAVNPAVAVADAPVANHPS